MRQIGIGLLLLLFTVACGAEKDDGDGGSPVTTTSTASSTVTMTATIAGQNGIAVVALESAGADTVAPIGNATVVDVTDLVVSASAHAAASSQRDQATARLGASRAELQRLRTLNADNHNVSDRAVQDAAAIVASDEAAVRAAVAATLAVEAAATQRWGATLARGVIHRASWARELADRGSVLIEAAFTNDIPPPPQIRVTGAMDRLVVARYAGRSPRVDARLQKPAHDYIAPATDLPVGLVSTVYGPIAVQDGVLVPKSAVVWNGDQPLVFLEERPGSYVQHPVSARTEIPGGYLETSLKVGQRVVATGAQQLFSEQHKPAAEK